MEMWLCLLHQNTTMQSQTTEIMGGCRNDRSLQNSQTYEANSSTGVATRKLHRSKHGYSDYKYIPLGVVQPPKWKEPTRLEIKRCWREPMANSYRRKLVNGPGLVMDKIVALMDLLEWRLQKTREAPIWLARGVEHSTTLRLQGTVQVYADPGYWIAEGEDEQPYLLCLLTMLRRDEAAWLLQTDYHDILADRRWTGGSHQFYDIRSDDSMREKLASLGFGVNSIWSRFSPFPLGQKYRAKKRATARCMDMNFAASMDWAQFKVMCDGFVEMDSNDGGVALWNPVEFALGCHQAASMDKDAAMGDLARRIEERIQWRNGYVRGSPQMSFDSLNLGHIGDKLKSAVRDLLGPRQDDMLMRATIGLPICLAAMWRHHEWLDWTIAITQYVNAIGLSTSLVSWIIKKVRKCYDTCKALWRGSPVAEELNDALVDAECNIVDRMKSWLKRGRPQSNEVGFDKIGVIFGAAGGLITVVLACIGIKNIPTSDKQITGFLTRFGLLGRCITSVEKIFEAGEKFVEMVTRLVRIYILRQDPAKVVQFYEMHEWCSKVSKLITSDFECNIKYNLELKTQFDALLHDGDRILHRLDHLKVHQNERTRFNKLYDQLSHLRSVVAGSGAGHAELRQAPVIVHFVGDSGCGKSSVLWPFFMDMTVRMGVTEFSQAKEAVYFRYAADASKHWDGYHNGVKICVVDDIFTKKDTETSPNAEVDEVIRMGNNAYWGLPMAHLSDKGTTYFSAPLVVWTSNREQFDFGSRTNSEAILTRISLRYRVKPKPQYSEVRIVGGREINSLIRDKVGAELRNNSMAIKDFVTFQKLNPQGDGAQVIVDDMTYDEMIKDVWSTLDSATSRHTMMLHGVGSYFEHVKKQWLKDESDDVARGGFGSECPLPGGSGGAAGCSAAEDKVQGAPQIFGYSWTTHRQVARRADGGDAALTRTWCDWVNGMSHYPVGDMVVRHIMNLDRIYGTNVREEAMHNLVNGEYLGMRNCLMVRGRLTIEEQREIVASIVRDGFEGAETKCALLSSFPKLAQCCQHSSKVPQVELERRLVMANKYYLGKESAEEMKRTCAIYFQEEEVLTEFSQNLSFVVMLIVMSLVSYYGLYKCCTGVQENAVACEVLRKELTRRPVGDVHSRSDETGGRTSGKVEQKTRGSGHSEECLADLERCIQEASGILYRYDDERPLGARLHEYRTANPEPWTCGCENGEIQGVLDQNAKEIGVLALQNMYKIEEWLPEAEQYTPIMNVFFVKGRLAIANKHLSLMLREDPDRKMRIVHALRPVGYEFQVKELRYMVPRRDQDKEKDLMLIEFPRRVHQHRDVVSKFMSAEDMSRLSEMNAVCLVGHAVVSHAHVLRQYFSNHAVAVDGVVDMSDEGKFVGSIRRYIKYKIQTVPGDCGALVIAYDERTNNKIVGIHAGGFDSNGYTGFAQPVTRESVEDLIELIKVRHNDSLVACEPPCDESLNVEVIGHMLVPDLQLEGTNQEYGNVNSGVHRNYESKIRRGPLYGVMQEPLTAPAVLRPRVVGEEVVDPMDKAREKVKPCPTHLLDPGTFVRSAQDVDRFLNSNVFCDDREVLTLQQAIEGKPGDPAYPPLNRKSSAGFGWTGTKQKYLGKDEYRFDHPEVVARVAAGLEKLKSGRRLNTIFVDTLKDERRDLARVNAMKTRMFCAGEMTFTIIFRMYFLGWAAHMYRNKREKESCVGINPLGVDWHLLALDLQKNGDNIIAGDFGNYDGSLPAEALWAVHDIIQNFYGYHEEHTRVRTGLWADLVNSWHVCGDVVYLWTQSNPSGCPITSLLNSVVHSILARYVWLALAEMHAPEMATMRQYYASVVHRNYGDDDVWSVSKNVVGWFNQQNLTEAFAAIGMTYTDETKKGTVRPCRSLREVEFLKRSFRWESSIARWVSPLRLDVILEMPMWIHSTSDPYLQSAETLEAAHRELACHSEDVFAQHDPTFRKAQEIVAKIAPCKLFDRSEILFERRVNELN